MPQAAVILAGGRGSRSANPGKAKVAQDVGGKPLLQWHFDNMADSAIDEVLVVAGHLSDQVESLVDSTDSHGRRVTVLREDRPSGTVPALQLAIEHTDATSILVILGDIWHSFPVDPFIRAWRETGKKVATITHPSLHPRDSDAVFTDPTGAVQVIPKLARSESSPNMSATGIFAIDRQVMAIAGTATDVGSDLLPLAARGQELFPHISSHYFKDTGTPERLHGAQDDWNSGTFSRRGAHTLRRGVILDRDGVINPAHPEVYSPEGLELIPGVAEEIARANALGVPVVVATNQPGIAKGFMTWDQHEAIRARLDALLISHGAFVDDYAFCPHHPDRGFPGEVAHLKMDCDCRKPEPGLLIHLANHHGLDASATVMVGDSDRDRIAAERAGMDFIAVNATCDPVSAIRRAIEAVTC